MIKKENYFKSTYFKFIFSVLIFIAMLFRDMISASIGLDTNSVSYGVYVLATSSALAAVAFSVVGTTRVTNIKIKLTKKSTIIFVFSLLYFAYFLLFPAGEIDNIRELTGLSITSILIALTVALGTGIFEEFLTRLLVLSAFLDTFKKNQFKFLWSSIFSSLFFGLLHLINLTNPSVTVTANMQQIFYAFIFGIVFASIRIKYNGMLWSVLLHALVDFQPNLYEAGSSVISWGSLIMMFSPLLIISVIFLVQLDKDFTNQKGICCNV